MYFNACIQILTFDAHVTESVLALDLRINLPSLIEMGIVSQTTPEIQSRAMPNPLRSLAGGEPLYSIFIDEWNDDVSRNRSKSYNKHYNTYIAIRNLPRKLLQQEFHIHFLGTSQFASMTEQNAAVRKMIMSFPSL